MTNKACIEANEFIKEFIWWKLHIANGVFVKSYMIDERKRR